MPWYKFWQKLNPVQPDIAADEGHKSSEEPRYKYYQYYESIEICNRAANMITDDCAEIDYVISDDQTPGHSVVTGMRKTTLNRVLNHEPNLYQDISSFRRDLVLDYLLVGNIFIYWDGKFMYHLPSDKVTIIPDEKTFVKGYKYNDRTFKPTEVIHVKENAFRSIYRGTSRLRSAERTLSLMTTMRTFQTNFFQNGAVAGLVIKSPNTLSERIKTRMLTSWMNKYRPDSGGRRPLILDGGLEVDQISDINFQELDFQPAINTNEKIVLKALGVPPILLDSGNNANIRPNLRLYYLETVLPIVRKLTKAYERFFGFGLSEDLTKIPSLQPELRDLSQFYTGLVNGGVITGNEARAGIGMEKLDKEPALEEIRIPANIAGSASDPNEGGRPENGEDNNGTETSTNE
jgi:HK97 family phage portal protein